MSAAGEPTLGDRLQLIANEMEEMNERWADDTTSKLVADLRDASALVYGLEALLTYLSGMQMIVSRRHGKTALLMLMDFLRERLEDTADEPKVVTPPAP